MSFLRECPHCASSGVEFRQFTFPSIDVAVVSCSCGASMSLPSADIEAAWNTRRHTDDLLLACLPVLKVFIMISVSHGLNANPEIALVSEIAAYLSKGGAV
jgi:hypothetical protein